MKETLTVHEALCDIKVADSKINAAIEGLNACASNKASAENVLGVPVKDFVERAESQYQKIMDLINRTEALKAAVNESNSKTMITVDGNGKAISIATAIYLMNNGMKSKKRLLENLKRQYLVATREITIKNGEELDIRTDKHIESLYGANAKDSKSVNHKDIEDAMEAFRKAQSYVLIDPLKVQDKIDKLSDELDKFQSHIDSAIQMSNATTNITIEY